MRILRFVWTLFLFTLAALPSACSPEPPGSKGAGAPGTYYIDAALGFAVEYPADWTRARAQTAPTVRWFPRTAKSRETDVMAAVTSLPPSEVPGGSERLLGDFSAAHPGFVLTAREHAALSETSALKVLGYTPHRTFLVLFVTSSRRAFVLEFSALPEYFDPSRPVFEKMIDTFRILD
jgi:hypothetical protein